MSRCIDSNCAVLCIVLLIVASDSQRDEAKLYIERYVMSRIYTQAMFPNGEADIMRDQSVHLLSLAFTVLVCVHVLSGSG